MPSDSSTTPAKIILYAHPTCPMLAPVWAMLKQSQVDFDYINIHQDDDARQRVREINNGYESVPTLVFPDGSTLTEPSAAKLRRKLRKAGYGVPVTAMILGNLHLIVTGIIVLWALLSFFEVI